MKPTSRATPKPLSERLTEIRSLTGIRGIAACYVMAYHLLQGPLNRGPVQTFVNHGYIAVDLFFVLSGFVMALTYAPLFAQRFEGRTYREFLWKRFGRVYPLYIVVTAAVILVAWLAWSAPWSAGTIAANVLLIQTWGLAKSIVDAAWSISTEFAAYIFFPLLLAVTVRGRWGITVLASMLAVAVLAFVASRSSIDLNQVYGGSTLRSGPLDVFGEHTPYPLLRCFAGFALGLVAFRVARAPGATSLFGRAFVPEAIASITVVLLFGRADVALTFFFALLVIALALADRRSPVVRLLGSPVAYWLGLISYSIYLTHRLTSDLFRESAFDVARRWHVPHAYTATGAAMIALTLALSTLTYHAVEKPGRDSARRLIGSRRPPPIEVEPSAP